MRMSPLVGRKAWFGPRRVGWGLSPISIEGWVATAAAVVTTVALAIMTRGARWIALIVPALLILMVFLKGTTPGGSAEWEAFQAAGRRPRDASQGPRDG